jgi:hypothetical protein
MDKGEVSIGVIIQPIIVWTNSANREFEWGYVGMAVDILETWESTYVIVDIGRGATPTQVFKDKIRKIDIVWKILK